MSLHLLIISEQDKDIRFGQHIAWRNSIPVHKASEKREVREFLIDHPQTIVFWDADDSKSAGAIAEEISKFLSPVKVFAITDKSLNTCRHLFKYPIFGHHLLRRYDEALQGIFSNLIAASVSPYPFGILRYFPKDTESRKITITRSIQKTAAVEAVQNVFSKRDVNSRLAALAAQATDELIMNAIFDAPVDGDGIVYRRSVDRFADIQLADREKVVVEVASSDDFIGICVIDNYGSIKKSLILNFLRKDYHVQPYLMSQGDPSGGLGLNGIVQAGLSLLLVSKASSRTEATLFFRNVKNYKHFKAGFRFLSIIAE